jgi:hypothetical protein
MSMRKRLRALCLCGALQIGALFGVPMRPEEIEALIQQMNGAKPANELPGEEDRGDPPPDPE